MSAAVGGATATATGKRQSTLRTLMGVGAGNLMEWYDWGVYAVFAPFFASAFFHSADNASGVLKTLAVFAVGFVARPFGGLVFGWMSDRFGRKTSMTWTIALAAGGSLAIGISPDYASIGIFASVVLVVARLAQGLAHGGELPAAQTYIAETAPRERRGLWSSTIYFSGTIGQLVALVLGAVLTGVLTKSQMTEWGWRSAFILGGLFGLYSLYMRWRLDESEVFDGDGDAAAEAGGTTPAPKQGMWATIAAHPKLLLQICGLVVGGTVLYYSWAVSTPAYAIAINKVPSSQALWAGAAAQVVFLIVLPIGGHLSDRYGRKPVLLISYAVLLVGTFPLSAMLGSTAMSLFIAMSLAMIPLAVLSAVAPAVYAEIFPTRIRTIGLALPYSLVVAIFGGTAPYLRTYFGDIGRPTMFIWYALILGVISMVTVMTLPETKGIDLRRTATEDATV